MPEEVHLWALCTAVSGETTISLPFQMRHLLAKNEFAFSISPSPVFENRPRFIHSKTGVNVNRWIDKKIDWCFDSYLVSYISRGSHGLMQRFSIPVLAPPALHISYVTSYHFRRLFYSNTSALRSGHHTIFRHDSSSKRTYILFIVHWSVRDVNLNCIYLQTYIMSHSSVHEDVAQRKSINECSEVK